MPGGFHAAAQSQGTAKTAPPRAPKPNPELISVSQQIQDLATAVPPELAAYALLQVAQARGLNKPEEQRQLIEQAYTLAGQSPYPVRMVLSAAGADTRAGYISTALGLGLDTLSLRTSAVTAMLRLDPARARELFQQLRPLPVERRSCTDTLLYDPGAYYRAALLVYRRGFTSDEQTKGMADDFLESIFRDVNQASEVGAASDLLQAVEFDPEILARAESAFGRAVNGIRGDYRSFQTTQNSFTRNIVRLGQIQGRASHALLESTRTYLIANYSGDVCADSVPNSTPGVNVPSPGASGDPFATLNQILIRNSIAPVVSTDLKPSSTTAVTPDTTQAYWQSQAAKQMQSDVSSLRSGPDAGDRKSPQWQEDVEHVLTALREWIDDSTEPSAEDFFIEKSELYSQVFSVAPSDAPVYDDVTNAYIAFLSEEPESADARIYWLWSIHSMVEKTRSSRTGDDAAGKRLETAVLNAPNPAIALYGYLQVLERAQRVRF